MSLMAAMARRLFVVALPYALLLSHGNALLAQPAPLSGSPEDLRILPYAKPGQLVDIGGRRINLLCSGKGSPTVVLMAGLYSWSVVWYKTQPVIAQRTQVCTFDRAAYGFSDPPPQPETIADVVDDLHAALSAAPLRGPYVLVGHSLGGLEARVFAQRWPHDVAGMVLVDTSPAGEGLILESHPGFDEAAGRESYASFMMHCAFLAVKEPFSAASPEFKDCSGATLPRDTPAAFINAWPGFFTAPYFAAKVSLMSGLYTHRYDPVDHRSLGTLPLVVLSPDGTWKSHTAAGERFYRAYANSWIAMHRSLARLSAHGTHRIVNDSGHEVQLDQPRAVVDAVNDVLRQLRDQSKLRSAG